MGDARGPWYAKIGEAPVLAQSKRAVSSGIAVTGSFLWCTGQAAWTAGSSLLGLALQRQGEKNERDFVDVEGQDYVQVAV